MPDGIKLKLEYVSLFVVGLTVGLLLYNAPLGEHWCLGAIYASIHISPLEALSPVADPTGNVYYRPIPILVVNALHGLFGLNYYIFHLFAAVILGMFGIVMYFFHLQVDPSKKKVAYLSSIFCMLSPPVLISMRLMVESFDELFGVIFLYLALIAFINLKKYEKLHVQSMISLILFILLALLTSFSKETSRAFLLIILCAYFFIAYKNKKIGINKLQITAVSLLLILVFLSSVITAMTPQRQIQPLTLNYVYFITTHSFTQLMYSIFVSGVLILIVSSILLIGKSKLYELLGGLSGIGLLTFMIVTPTLIVFSFNGLIVFSAGLPLIPIFSILLVIALAIKFVKGNFINKFYSASTLAALAAVIFVTLFIPFIREDVSSRAYTAVIPLLIYLVVDSFFIIFKKIKNDKLRVNKVLLTVVFVFSLVAVPYFFFSSAVNLSNEFIAHSTTEYKTKSYLAEINLSNSMVFYTDFDFPLYKADLELLGANAENIRNTHFIYLSPQKDKVFFIYFSAYLLSDDMYKMMDKICEKYPDAGGNPREIYVYYVRRQAALESASLRSLLEGDFEWTERNTFEMFNFPRQVGMDYGFVRLSQKSVYGNQTSLENFLHENNATLIYAYNTSYYQVYPWLEDFPSRIANGIPYIIRYSSTGKIYHFNVTHECTGI